MYNIRALKGEYNMYRIGEFSNMTGLSIRTLRYYDEIGLLVPKIDEWTGYREYTDQNFEEVKYIKILKFLGYSLDEIIEAKQAFTIDILKNKREELERNKDLIECQLEYLNLLESGMNEQSISQDDVVKLTKNILD